MTLLPGRVVCPTQLTATTDPDTGKKAWLDMESQVAAMAWGVLKTSTALTLNKRHKHSADCESMHRVRAFV